MYRPGSWGEYSSGREILPACNPRGVRPPIDARHGPDWSGIILIVLAAAIIASVIVTR